ncbi:FK506-binding 2 [Fusarium mexicanum]|uniref:FK506-binding 2 n=1 Tax=Fusarium mexicanum TaxID=751941 RepID=A0A8H5JGT8_9HYPO|nr:FK506-binding 2 [Fusarium mexicanum]
MKTALFLSVNGSSAVGIIAEDLKIESALVIIYGGTEKGNENQMYCRNTLKDSDNEFLNQLSSSSIRPGIFIVKDPGYLRSDVTGCSHSKLLSNNTSRQ